MSLTLHDVCQFLFGEAPLDGVWFGDKPPGQRAALWWRHHLRQAMKTQAPPDMASDVCRQIQKRVAAHYGIPVEAMWSPSRRREWAWPRMVAMVLCRERGLSFSTVGLAFKRDHSTVLNAIRNVEDGTVEIPDEVRTT